MKLSRIDYKDLSGKQQEIYNFQKAASALADYGFNCIKLADDWNGADFLAYHKDGLQTLNVQLKSRLTIDRKYLGKSLYIIFPLAGSWCLVPHDHLVEIVSKETNWLVSRSWTDKGCYHAGRPSRSLLAALNSHVLV